MGPNNFSGVYTKDARFLLTINAWRRFGKVNRIIFCIRHPYEISKSLKKRDLNSKLVRRRGRVYIINKKNPKFKARQK